MAYSSVHTAEQYDTGPVETVCRIAGADHYFGKTAEITLTIFFYIKK